MTDTLTASPRYYPDELGAEDLGLTTLRDNHGNSYSYEYLTCAGKPSVGLKYEDSLKLDLIINRYATLEIFRPPGEITTFFGSLLEAKCHELWTQPAKAGPKTHSR